MFGECCDKTQKVRSGETLVLSVLDYLERGLLSPSRFACVVRAMKRRGVSLIQTGAVASLRRAFARSGALPAVSLTTPVFPPGSPASSALGSRAS